MAANVPNLGLYAQLTDVRHPSCGERPASHLWGRGLGRSVKSALWTADSNHRRTTQESQRPADERRRCGDAKGPCAERDREGQDLGAASTGVERAKDRPPDSKLGQSDGEASIWRGRRYPPAAPPAPGALPDARRARGDLARRSPAVSRHARSPAAWAAPTRRSRVRSVAAAGGVATAPTPPSARPGAGLGARGRPSSSSAPSFDGWSKSAFDEDNSPEQIAGWLRIEYPDNEAMQVSHETIYRALYVQARGTLKRELTQHLRRGRSKRYARSQSSKRQGQGKITEMVMISERPPEVEDRAVPGHWEGDLLMGNAKNNAIATLVERSTRYCQLVALPEGATAERVCEALKASITTLPAQLRRSLTWDQGSEMSEHRRFSVETGRRRLLLRSPKPLAAGLQREHQRIASPVLPEGQEPRGDRPGAPRRGRRQAQQPAAKDARLPDPGREAHRADRRARRALISLRPTAFARQRSKQMEGCETSGVVH